MSQQVSGHKTFCLKEVRALGFWKERAWQVGGLVFPPLGWEKSARLWISTPRAGAEQGKAGTGDGGTSVSPHCSCRF